MCSIQSLAVPYLFRGLVAADTPTTMTQIPRHRTVFAMPDRPPTPMMPLRDVATGTGPVTLPRKGRKPLQFQGELACQTTEGADEIALWTRRDGRLAVSVRSDDAMDAAVLRDIAAAQDWVESLCRAPKEAPLPKDRDALTLLAELEARTKAALRQDRLARLATQALAQWPQVMTETERTPR